MLNRDLLDAQKEVERIKAQIAEFDAQTSTRALQMAEPVKSAQNASAVAERTPTGRIKRGTSDALISGALNGVRKTPDEIANAVGASIATVRRKLIVLEESGFAEKSGKGWIRKTDLSAVNGTEKGAVT